MKVECKDEEMTRMTVGIGKAVETYIHFSMQADSKTQAEIFFVDGNVPEIGDEVKLIVTGSKQVDDRYFIEINMKAVGRDKPTFD